MTRRLKCEDPTKFVLQQPCTVQRTILLEKSVHVQQKSANNQDGEMSNLGTILKLRLNSKKQKNLLPIKHRGVDKHGRF